jgi:hypothetical protein
MFTLKLEAATEPQAECIQADITQFTDERGYAIAMETGTNARGEDITWHY